MPRRASLVFVLDASHSLRDFRLGGQLKLVRAIAEQFPQSKIQIIAFRHRATALFRRFVNVAQLDRKIAALPPEARELGNGSHLESGLVLAAKSVAKRRGAVRIFAITDSRMRSSFSNRVSIAALGTVPAATVVHVVDFDPSNADLLEKTAIDHALADIASAHGGTTLNVSGTTNSHADVLKVTRHLVTPTRIEELTLEAAGLVEIDATVAPLGTGLRVVGLGENSPYRVRLRGKLWSSPWQLHAERSPSFSATAAKLTLADPSVELDEDQVTELATRVGVASEKTSFLATTGDVVKAPLGFGYGGTGYGST